MLNILIISLANASLSGGSMASRSNYLAFKNVAGAHTMVVGPPDLDYATWSYEPRLSVAGKLESYCRFRPAINYQAVLESASLPDARIDLVFLDNSLLGPLIPALRAKYRYARIAVVFLNIESDAYRSMMDRTHPASWVRLLSLGRAERTAAIASDYRITLSQADAALLERRFGTPSDAVWPVTYPPADRVPRTREVGEDYVLFVGGHYKPNLDAIAYLATRVAPHVNKKVVVAGFDLGAIRQQYRQHQNLVVFDSPPSLAPMYQYASLVVAPIFSGGGIKTKVIEALSYGRAVLASRAAATGFEHLSANSLRIADADADYIDAINAASLVAADPAIIAEFERYYAPQAKIGAVRQLVHALGLEARLQEGGAFGPAAANA